MRKIKKEKEDEKFRKHIKSFNLNLPDLTSLFLIISFLNLNHNKKIYLENLRIVPNPLEKMIFSPEICDTMGRNFWIFNLTYRGLYICFLVKYNYF